MNNEPTEIYRYMQFRSEQEETVFDLTPEWFAAQLEPGNPRGGVPSTGRREMFGVQVSSFGDVISDPTHLELLVEWKATNPGPFAGKTSTRCSVCFEDFTEDDCNERAELGCECSEDLCRKCWTIHVTRTALKCHNEECDLWHVWCPTCEQLHNLKQEFFHHCHQTCVHEHWLG
jgi:hypothetical protein